MGPLATPFLTILLTLTLLIRQIPLPSVAPSSVSAIAAMPSVMVPSAVPEESPFTLSEADYAAIRADNCPDNGPALPEAEWRDRLIYFPYTRHDSWPIPDGNTTKNVLCYDAALTMCMALTLRDYTMTIDSLYDEIVAEYGEEKATERGHMTSFGKRTMWPTTIIGYCEEKYGIRNRVIKKTDNALDLVRDALLQGHVVVAGDGRPMDFYRDASKGDTYHCKSGHTIMFYKYENGTFYAKDWGVGPKVAYPESGGKIDLRDWMAKNSRGYIGLIEFYMEEQPRPKYPDIEL